MNISLIGMMGSGKTTIGKKLAINGFSFVDTDEEIVKQEKRSINEIFSENGEAYFREIESKIIEEVLKKDNQIISTGGGIITKDGNIALLKEKSKVIYLKANANTLFARVKNNKERPLLNCDDMYKKIISLLDEREYLYEKAAHNIIQTDNKSISEIIEEIQHL